MTRFELAYYGFTNHHLYLLVTSANSEEVGFEPTDSEVKVQCLTT